MQRQDREGEGQATGPQQEPVESDVGDGDQHRDRHGDEQPARVLGQVIVRTDRRCQLGVVANLRMDVERKVRAVKRDVVFQREF